SPYAPRGRESENREAARKLNSEISEILGDIREIQASLYRVYDPEAQAAEPEVWMSEIQSLNADAVNKASIEGTQHCDKEPAPPTGDANVVASESSASS